MTVVCEDALPFLSAYFDRELDIAKSLEVEGHLQECERCVAALKQHEALRAALGAAPLAFVPPAGFESRVRKAVRREARPRTRFTFAPWRWAAVPLVASLAAVLSWSLAIHHATSTESAMLGELVSGHVRSLQVDHLVDVTSSDQHTVKPWFNGKVDFAPRVADFTADGFPLVGGRVDYVAGRPVAALVYRHRQHVINVFIWPAGSDGGAAIEPFAAAGYHLLRWQAAGLTYWAVSDLNPADLESLARLLQQTS